MKKILRSLLVIGLVATMAAGATKAWFTSQVTAADNQITTGTLMLAIDSTQNHTTVPRLWGFPNAYTVAEDIDGVNSNPMQFEPWLNAEPGVFAPYNSTWPRQAGNFSVWFAVRNKGTLPFNYRAAANGRWTVYPRITNAVAESECSGVTPNASLVSVQSYYRYASDNCEGNIECENIYYALRTGPWVNKPGVTALPVVADPVTGFVNGDLDLNPNEFVIYRVDLQLDENTSNCYQGATYTYDLITQAKQLLAPSF